MYSPPVSPKTQPGLATAPSLLLSLRLQRKNLSCIPLGRSQELYSEHGENTSPLLSHKNLYNLLCIMLEPVVVHNFSFGLAATLTQRLSIVRNITLTVSGKTKYYAKNFMYVVSRFPHFMFYRGKFGLLFG